MARWISSWARCSARRIRRPGFIRNTNPAGWPIKAAEPVAFSPGAMAGFLDVDGDGTLDSVCVTHDERWGTRNFCSRVAWHKGLGGSPPQYGPEQFLEGIDDELCEFVSTVDDGGRKGVIVSAGYIGERMIVLRIAAECGSASFQAQRGARGQCSDPRRRSADAVHLRLERRRQMGPALWRRLRLGARVHQ